mmetsp:Transcript_105817/g.252417  ORF Transcript_105817/g.252417 Transcript_105817/m.252417 type:complete len:153 (-) Transcript_105817:40-498(-)
MSGVTSTLVWRDAIIKENRCRRSYYLGRFGSGAIPKPGDAGVYDPYNNDKVSAISPQRAVAIPEIAGYQSWEKFRHAGRLVVADGADVAEAASRPVSGVSAAPSRAHSAASEARTLSQRSKSSHRSLASLRTAIEAAVDSELARAGLKPYAP